MRIRELCDTLGRLYGLQAKIALRLGLCAGAAKNRRRSYPRTMSKKWIGTRNSRCVRPKPHWPALEQGGQTTRPPNTLPPLESTRGGFHSNPVE